MAVDDLEQVLLGLVLAGYRDIPKIAGILTADDFDQRGHGLVWDALLAVHRSGMQPDAYNVVTHLGSAVKHVGGAGYLHDLLEKARPVATAQAPWYAGQVREQAVKRHAANLGARLQQMRDDPDSSSDDIRAEVRGLLDSLERQQTTGTVTVWEAIERVIDTAQHGEPRATPTPWGPLTDLLGGWYPGQLVIVGARPSVGKSLMLENVATDCARRGRRVLFVSLEMSAKEITQRTFAHTARVSLSAIRAGAGRLSEVEFQALENASTKVGEACIEFTESPYMTVDAIRSAAWSVRQAALRAEQPFGLVVVDYAQLIVTSGKGMTRQQMLGEVSRGLKRLAKELEVPVIAAAQLNRGAVDRLPLMSDLREAGDFEADADVVILLHEDTVEDSGRNVTTDDLEVIVAKSRNGPVGTVGLHKYGHFARLETTA